MEEQHAHVSEAPKPEKDLPLLNLSPVALVSGSTTDSPIHLLNERSTPVDPLKKVRTSGGSDRSVEQSPVHSRNQVKASWERRASSEGSHGAPSTPGRFKSKTGGRGDELPDDGPTVPKFGEWDENNPSSADGYTQLFNQVREEKQTGAAKVPIVTNDAMYLNSYNQDGSYKSLASPEWSLMISTSIGIMLKQEVGLSRGELSKPEPAYPWVILFNHLTILRATLKRCCCFSWCRK